MPDLEIFVAQTEFKFAESQPGAFEGYASVYGILDSHKDVVEKGAFEESLATHAKNGTMPSLYAEHSAYVDGGDPLPVGVYSEIKSDDKGLRVKGKISSLDTDHGKRIYGLMKDKALTGLSIAYSVPPGGARMGKKQGEARRTLTKIDLKSVDIVANPSNDSSRIDDLKSKFRAHLKDAGADEEFTNPDIDTAIDFIAAAIFQQDKMMSNGGYWGSAKECALMMEKLRGAHLALTGEAVPDGLEGWMKNSPFTIGVIRTNLVKELGLSRKRADEIAKRLFDSLPRDEKSKPAATGDTKTAMGNLAKVVSEFKIPNIGA